MIQPSLRYKTDGPFWSSFFHEAGHILKDPKKEIFINHDTKDQREDQADRFAADFLIPPEYQPVLSPLKTRTAVVRFARSIDIAPGIVVGRLQKEKILEWKTRLNDLKGHFQWRT